MIDLELIALARNAREQAYAPYSNFKVGAALLTEDDHVYSGCNVENSSYGLTVCAERVALLKAASEGTRKIRKIAVVTDSSDLASPCGACRQMIWEFADHKTEVILANLSGKLEILRIGELLPRPFDASFLPAHKE